MTGRGHVQFMKKRPEEELLDSSLAAKPEAGEPQKQKQKLSCPKL